MGGSAARRRSDRNMGGLRGIDMFRKIPADLTSATTTGAIQESHASLKVGIGKVDVPGNMLDGVAV